MIFHFKWKSSEIDDSVMNCFIRRESVDLVVSNQKFCSNRSPWYAYSWPRTTIDLRTCSVAIAVSCGYDT